MTSGASFLVGYMLLALGMFQQNGHYDLRALILVILSFAFVLRGVCILCHEGRATQSMPSSATLALALLFLMYTSTLKEPGIYIIDHLYSAKTLLIHSILIVTIAGVFHLSRASSRIRIIVLWMAIICAIILRIGMLMASPLPSIDVFTNITNGVASLFHGENPYLSADSFDYLPANLYLHSIPWWIFGDIRALYIIAEIVTLISILAVRIPLVSQEQKGLIGLLFLYHPRSLFVLEQAWLDPLILMFWSLFLMLRSRRIFTTASALFGYMISMKQYLIFLPIHSYVLDQNRRRATIMIGVAFATVLPFVLIMGPRDFLHLGVLPLVSTPFRTDSLTVPAFFVNVIGTKAVTSAWSMVVGGIATCLSLLYLRSLAPTVRFTAGSMLTMFALFLFGAQAFCNYYYLVGGMILWTLLIHTESGASDEKHILP